MKRENFENFYAMVIEPNIQVIIKMSQDFVENGCVAIKKMCLAKYISIINKKEIMYGAII